MSLFFSQNLRIDIHHVRCGGSVTPQQNHEDFEATTKLYVSPYRNHIKIIRKCLFSGQKENSMTVAL